VRLGICRRGRDLVFPQSWLLTHQVSALSPRDMSLAGEFCGNQRKENAVQRQSGQGVKRG
jgi:hypothetical protein